MVVVQEAWIKVYVNQCNDDEEKKRTSELKNKICGQYIIISLKGPLESKRKKKYNKKICRIHIWAAILCAHLIRMRVTECEIQYI